MIDAKNDDIDNIVKVEGVDSDKETVEEIHAGMVVDIVPHRPRA